MNNNLVVLIGRLTKTPEINFMPRTGSAVSKISLAVDDYNSKSGKNEAIFIPIEVWGKQAESLVKYMDKGCQLSIVGKLKQNNWTDKEGRKHYDILVRAVEIKFLSFPKEYSNKENTMPVNDSDMPF